MLQATPQRRPWLVAAAAPHKAAELCDPAHGLAQRGWLVRRRRTVMDGTIQRLPFLDLQQHATRHLGHRPRQHGGIKHPPGNDAVERQTALQALAGGQLAGFDATATFQNPMPDFNAPATGVPWTRSMASSTVWTAPWSTAATRWADPAGGSTSRTCTAHSVTSGKPSALRCRGGHSVKGQNRSASVAHGGLRATTRHLQAELLHHGLGLHGGPHIALGRDTAVPRGPNQQLDALRTRGRQQVIDIGFPVAHADKAGLGTLARVRSPRPPDW